ELIKNYVGLLEEGSENGILNINKVTSLLPDRATALEYGTVS
ncbi:MAG: hypothetical protein ACI86H_000266, partial [bacterium]